MPKHFLSSLDGTCTLTIERSGQMVASNVEIARDSAARRRGLLGRDSIDRDQALIIAPSQGIHTFGMRFAIDVIAADRDGRVVKTRSRVAPRRVVLAWSAFAFIELHLGALDLIELREGDRLVCAKKYI
jgi:uncharacterized membrane protein (UPF0127 family)